MTCQVQVNLGRSSFEASEVRGKLDSTNVWGHVLNVFPSKARDSGGQVFP
jgi:hypothetical protein